MGLLCAAYIDAVVWPIRRAPVSIIQPELQEVMETPALPCMPRTAQAHAGDTGLFHLIAGIPEPSAASQLEASADDYSIGSRSAAVSPQQQYDDSSLQASPSSTMQAAESPARQGTGKAAAGVTAGDTDLPGGYNPQNYAKLMVPEDVQVTRHLGSIGIEQHAVDGWGT